MEDNYRWYLCVQGHTNDWSCARVTEKEALYPHVGDSLTKALFISSLTPKIFDPLILKISLIPKVNYVG